MGGGGNINRKRNKMGGNEKMKQDLRGGGTPSIR